MALHKSHVDAAKRRQTRRYLGSHRAIWQTLRWIAIALKDCIAPEVLGKTVGFSFHA